MAALAVFIYVTLTASLTLVGCSKKETADDQSVKEARTFPTPQIPFAPKTYVCYRTSGPIAVDGRIDEDAWSKAGWTDAFVDIEGDLKPLPRFKTQAAMLWDDDYFYVAARMKEPQVWGTLTERDAVIYHDNDFEVFIDPDGDTHDYYELEINALGTVWDLLLKKPYRDGGPALNEWDIDGLLSAVHIDGTLNDPNDVDSGWTVELAFPWSVLKEYANRPAPPNDGDQWRINFSRVEWQVDTVDGNYVKRTDSTGKDLPENNWVWSPQGLIAMHYPERWGVVQFTTVKAGKGEAPFIRGRTLADQAVLFELYYAQKEFYEHNGRWAKTLGELRPFLDTPGSQLDSVSMQVDKDNFSIRLTTANGVDTLTIRQDGRVTATDNTTP